MLNFGKNVFSMQQNGPLLHLIGRSSMMKTFRARNDRRGGID